MIGKILAYIDSIKLTLTQWLVLTLSAIIGGLLLALRLQGSKLHKVQVQLLETQVNAQEDTDDHNVGEARNRYQTALNEFLKAGGTL